MPWTTSISTPAASRSGVSSRARCGLTRAATVTPASRTRFSASASSAVSIGTACSSCRSATAAAGSSARGRDHPGQRPVGVGVPGPQPLGVEHGQAAELPDPDGARGRHHGVGRMGDQRDLERVGVELPGGGHLLRTARAPRRHDLDLLEVVAAPGLPAHPDLHEVPHG